MRSNNSKKQQSQAEAQPSQRTQHSTSQRDTLLNNYQLSKQNSERSTITQKVGGVKSPKNNMSSSNSSNSGKFQPILKGKDDISNKNVSGPQPLKKQGSGTVDKKMKSGSKQLAMKEAAFNYEERSASKQDSTPNQKIFRKNSPFAQTDDIRQIVARYTEADDQIIEVKQDDSVRHEDRIRPSDEVQYQEYDNSNDNMLGSFSQQLALKELRGTTSSFKVIEERKTEFKDFKVIEPEQQHEQFEVIREETKDGSYILADFDPRHNSDFKRFNLEEDITTGQGLRLGNQSNFPFNKYGEYSNQKGRFQNEAIQETPKSIKEKTRNAKPQQIPNEKSLQGTNVFIQNNHNDGGTSSPQSFGSPQKGVTRPQQNLDVAYEKNQAHILSFSDQNQMYQLEYPPLQQNEDQLLRAQIRHQDSITSSPSAFIQQQRIADLMKYQSQDDNGQAPMSQQKIDEQTLNNMIDMEKNYVIMQYESILQQLNVEFHKLLQKTKESDETVLSKEALMQAQSKMIAEKESSQFQLEQVNRQLSLQIQEMLQEIEFLQRSQQQVPFENNDAWRYERDILDEKIESLQNKINLHEQNEIDLKDQLENALNKLRAGEQKQRLKDEEMFLLQKDNQSLQRDIKNIKDIEQTLKAEILSGQGSRRELEDALQETKQKVCSLQIQIRQKEGELDNVIRENRNMKGTLDSLQSTFNELIQENNTIKDNMTASQQEILQMRTHMEKQSRDFRGLQQELKNSQMIQEQQRLSQQNMEDYYRTEIQRLTNSLKEQQHQQPQYQRKQEVYHNPDENNNSMHKEEKAYRSNQQFNNTITYKDNSEFQKPLQEHNQNYYSPQRNLRGQNVNQIASKLSPQPDFNSKNTIVWPFQFGNVTKQLPQSQPQISQKQPSSEMEKYQQHVPQRNDNSMKSRRQTLNQNDSQLHDVLAWNQNSKDQSQNVQQYPPPKVQRSLERLPNSQPDSNGYNFLNQPHVGETKILKQQELQQMRSPQNYQQQQVHKSQDQDMPYAGKKSTTQSSPFKGRNTEQQVTHLQNSLSALQIDKEKLENEYRKFGAPKNRLQIEKKQELEFEVEIVNKNIQNIKQKLREMNAL